MPYTNDQLNGRYERALICKDAEFSDIPADSGGGIAAAGLREAFDEIRQKDVDKQSFGTSAKAGTGQRTTARENLKDYRRHLAETANFIAAKKAGFNADYPFASGETDEELITNTRAIIPKAVDSKEDFRLRGLLLDYLQTGTALVDIFEATFDATNTALSHRGAAVGGKKSAYQRAAEFFDDLDIYIRNAYRDQPDKLNAWRNASHIRKTAAKKNGENGENENPPTQ